MSEFRISASTSTRLPLGIDPSTPLGLSKAFALGAGECLAAARRLDEGFPDLTGEYIVAFHAIELGLKSYLIKHGVTVDELRRPPHGHNLVNLYQEAIRRGLSLAVPHATELIEWANEWHSDGVKIRYEFAEARTLPMCVLLFPLAEAIIVACGDEQK